MTAVWRPAAAAALVAALATPLAAAERDLAAEAVALAPALRACLSGLPPEAFAIEAAPAGPGLLRVRIWQGAAALDCTVPWEGGAPRRQPAPGARPPEASAPAFFLDRRCVDARRVEAPDGAVLGWLAYPACG